MVLKILMGEIQHDMTLNCVCPAGYNYYQLHCIVNTFVVGKYSNV